MQGGYPPEFADAMGPYLDGLWRSQQASEKKDTPSRRKKRTKKRRKLTKKNA